MASALTIESVILETLMKAWGEIHPLPSDDDAYVGDTVTVPASSVVTITWTLKTGYNFYIKLLYADAAAGCTYDWSCNYLLGYDYTTTKEMTGNEHEFAEKRLVAKGGAELKLIITNISTNDYDLDLVLEMWARRVK